MHASIQAAVLLVFTLAAVSCSSRPGGTPAGPDRNLITRVQLAETRFTNVYDAVASLRPNWLTTKFRDSFVSPGEVLVYHDNIRLGGVENLRDIATHSVESVRFYDPAAASARWGLDHGHGVIFVSTLAEKLP